MTKRQTIYVASPYTKGDVAVNVKLQIEAGHQLMNFKFIPFLPLLSHFQHMAHPRPYGEWIEIDLCWVEKCDILLRLGGDSEGADGEVEYAKTLGIPVVYSIEDLLKMRYRKENEGHENPDDY